MRIYWFCSTVSDCCTYIKLAAQGLAHAQSRCAVALHAASHRAQALAATARDLAAPHARAAAHRVRGFVKILAAAAQPAARAAADYAADAAERLWKGLRAGSRAPMLRQAWDDARRVCAPVHTRLHGMWLQMDQTVRAAATGLAEWAHKPASDLHPAAHPAPASSGQPGLGQAAHGLPAQAAAGRSATAGSDARGQPAAPELHGQSGMDPVGSPSLGSPELSSRSALQAGPRPGDDVGNLTAALVNTLHADAGAPGGPLQGPCTAEEARAAPSARASAPANDAYGDGCLCAPAEPHGEPQGLPGSGRSGMPLLSMSTGAGPAGAGAPSGAAALQALPPADGPTARQLADDGRTLALVASRESAGVGATAGQQLGVPRGAASEASQDHAVHGASAAAAGTPSATAGAPMQYDLPRNATPEAPPVAAQSANGDARERLSPATGVDVALPAPVSLPDAPVAGNASPGAAGASTAPGSLSKVAGGGADGLAQAVALFPAAYAPSAQLPGLVQPWAARLVENGVGLTLALVLVSVVVGAATVLAYLPQHARSAAARPGSGPGLGLGQGPGGAPAVAARAQAGRLRGVPNVGSPGVEGTRSTPPRAATRTPAAASGAQSPSDDCLVSWLESECNGARLECSQAARHQAQPRSTSRMFFPCTVPANTLFTSRERGDAAEDAAHAPRCAPGRSGAAACGVAAALAPPRHTRAGLCRQPHLTWVRCDIRAAVTCLRKLAARDFACLRLLCLIAVVLHCIVIGVAGPNST